MLTSDLPGDDNIVRSQKSNLLSQEAGHNTGHYGLSCSPGAGITTDNRDWRTESVLEKQIKTYIYVHVLSTLYFSARRLTRTTKNQKNLDRIY